MCKRSIRCTGNFALNTLVVKAFDYCDFWKSLDKLEQEICVLLPGGKITTQALAREESNGFHYICGLSNGGHCISCIWLIASLESPRPLCIWLCPYLCPYARSQFFAYTVFHYLLKTYVLLFKPITLSGCVSFIERRWIWLIFNYREL